MTRIDDGFMAKVFSIKIEFQSYKWLVHYKSNTLLRKILVFILINMRYAICSMHLFILFGFELRKAQLYHIISGITCSFKYIRFIDFSNSRVIHLITVDEIVIFTDPINSKCKLKAMHSVLV